MQDVGGSCRSKRSCTGCGRLGPLPLRSLRRATVSNEYWTSHSTHTWLLKVEFFSSIRCDGPMASPPCVLTLREKAPNYLHRDHVTAGYLHGENVTTNQEFYLPTSQYFPVSCEGCPGPDAGGSYASAASRTLFGWTNETANVWTTIVALVIVNVLYLSSR